MDPNYEWNMYEDIEDGNPFYTERLLNEEMDVGDRVLLNQTQEAILEVGNGGPDGMDITVLMELVSTLAGLEDMGELVGIVVCVGMGIILTLWCVGCMCLYKCLKRVLEEHNGPPEHPIVRARPRPVVMPGPRRVPQEEENVAQDPVREVVQDVRVLRSHDHIV